MSDKGGGSQPQQAPTQQTITQTNIPAYAEPYVTDVMQQAKGISNTAYQPYNQAMVAPLSANQQQSIDLAGQYAGQTPQQLGQATNNLNNLPQVQSGIFGLPQAQQYMNPYTQQALNPALQEIQRQSDIQQEQINANATGQHAFGGYRQALQNSEQQRNTDFIKSSTEAQGLQQAYQNAQQQFNTANAGQMQATQANAQNSLGASQELGKLAGLQSDIQARGITNLQSTGALQQQNQQQGLDAAYQAWQNAINYPRQNLSYYSSLVRGMTPSVSQDVQQYQAPPSPYSQLAGLGIGALGLSKLFTS